MRLDSYRWLLVGVLSCTVTASYGILMYAFAAVLAPMQAELEWSQATLTGGFSLAALTAGIAAIPIGRWLDRFSPRVIMTAGSAGATALVFCWSQVNDPLAYYVIWIGLGACMAAVFYEPAFAVVAQWFGEQRTRALTIITLAGGLASTIFVPITSWLVITNGWRSALIVLAFVLGVLTLLPHAIFLRRRPADAAHEPDPVRHPPAFVVTNAFRTATFRWLAPAFFLSAVANFAVMVHIVPLCLDRGYSPAFAASALAMLGLAKLPGRLLVMPLSKHTTTATATLWIFALQAVAIVAMLMVPGAGGVAIFVALFGAGDGASTPARADLVAELFGTRDYGRISGILAFFVAMGRAAAPIGASIAYVALGGYDPVLWILGGMLVAAAMAMARVAASSTRASIWPPFRLSMVRATLPSGRKARPW